MGGRGLQPRHGGVHHVGGDARRPARPPPLYVAGVVVFTAGVDRVRPRALARRAQRRARRAGRGGGNRQRHLARARQRRVSRAQAARRARSASGPRSPASRNAVGPTLGGVAGRDRRLAQPSSGSTCRSASSSCALTLRYVGGVARRASAHARPRRPGACSWSTVGALRVRGDRRAEARAGRARDPRAVRDRRSAASSRSCATSGASPTR